jgi:hypothetical protein
MAHLTKSDLHFLHKESMAACLLDASRAISRGRAFATELKDAHPHLAVRMLEALETPHVVSEKRLRFEMLR